MLRRILTAALFASALAACPASNNGDGGTSATSSKSSSSSGASFSGSGSSSSSSSRTSSSNSSSSGGGTVGFLATCPADAGVGPTCVVTLTDSQNCGACGVTCAQEQTCSFGICRAIVASGYSCNFGSTTFGPDGGIVTTCPEDAGTTQCPTGDGGNGCPCPDLQTDPGNCGACGNSCGQGQICSAGSCAPACSAGEVEDLTLTSSQGASCVPAASAPAQVDVGPISLAVTLCPATGSQASPFLATVSNDPNNCGSCGNACGQISFPNGGYESIECIDGSCAPPCGTPQGCNSPTSFLSDGGLVCPTGTSACANAECGCADLQSDPYNCGSCGNICLGGGCQGGQCGPGCPSGQVCAILGSISNGNGYCVSSCSSYFGLPMTSCSDPTQSATYCALTQLDSSNCGACGNGCPSGQSCAAGTCAPTCDGVQCGNNGGYCGLGQTCVGGSCVAACTAGQSCNTLYSACMSSCG